MKLCEVVVVLENTPVEKKSIAQQKLIHDLINRVETVIFEAEKKHRAIETEPHRGNLFEVFVMAEGAGLLGDEEPNLDADKLVAVLAERWGLKQQAVDVMVNRAADLGPEKLSKMRLLLAVIRMWMEWTYAWNRWQEFHGGKPVEEPSPTPEADDNND